MIHVRLAGGLGNQIFQLGASLLFAKKNNISEIILDSSALGSYDVKRQNELLNFFDLTKSSVKISEKVSLINKFRIPVHSAPKLSFWPFVGDKNYQYALNHSISPFIVLDGYFQESITQLDFNDEIELLKNMFLPIKNKTEKECVIHIRGGDFVTLGWNIITPKEYYFKAIETMQSQYNINNFLVVTDDKNYAKSIMNELNISYDFIGNSLEEDFLHIAKSQYRILSSSTFALWASALGDNKSSVVIAPKYWRPSALRINIKLPNEVNIIYV